MTSSRETPATRGLASDLGDVLGFRQAILRARGRETGILHGFRQTRPGAAGFQRPCYHEADAAARSHGIPAAGREEALRREMVARFVAPRGVDDPRVLEAMREVPRHRFVPEPLRARAYGDHSLPIGHGQTISQPYVVGVMTQRLGVEPEHKVLEIGSGSGYQTAVLATLARSVYSLERIDELARAAAAALRVARLPQRVGQGLRRDLRVSRRRAVRPDPRHRRNREVPEPLLAQLAIGGRLVVPIGPPEQAAPARHPAPQDRLRPGRRGGRRLRPARSGRFAGKRRA